MNPVFADLPTTVFETMSRLARQYGAVNLGQGFPEDPGPLDVRQRAAEAVVDGSNQYPPMMGLPELRQAVADHYGRFGGLAIKAEDVMVTSGATEALAGALLALIEPGDRATNCLNPMPGVAGDELAASAVMDRPSVAGPAHPSGGGPRSAIDAPQSGAGAEHRTSKNAESRRLIRTMTDGSDHFAALRPSLVHCSPAVSTGRRFARHRLSRRGSCV